MMQQRPTHRVIWNFPEFGTQTPILAKQVIALDALYPASSEYSRMTMEQASFVLTLGSYMDLMWEALVEPSTPMDPTARFMAVASILDAPGLAPEIVEYHQRVLELDDAPEKSIMTNRALLDRVLRVVRDAPRPYGDLSELRHHMAMSLDKPAAALAVPWTPKLPPNSRNRGARATPQAPTTQCNRCKGRFPSDHVERQFMPKYMNGRRKNGYVWMCSDCASLQRTNNQSHILLMIVVILVTAGLFALIEAAAP